MADFLISAGNWYIYPTFGTLGLGAGAQSYKGSYHDELTMEILLGALAGPAFVYSGMVVPGSSGSLVLAIPSGVAVISGRIVTVPGSTNLTMNPSTTNYIFLKLQRDADSYVVSAAYEVNTTGTAPADSVPIASAVADTSTVTSTIDLRPILIPKGSANRMEVHYTAGAFTFVPKRTGAHQAIIIGGGGGGGAGAGAITTTTNYASGGGGGGGAFTILNIDLTAGVAVSGTVGAAGTAGAGTSGGPALAATAGGASSFAGTSSNGGGPGGFPNPTTAAGAAGAAGAATATTSAIFGIAGAAGLPGLAASGGASRNGGDGAAPAGFAGASAIGNSNFNPQVSAPGINPGGGGAGGPGVYNSPFGTGLTVYTAGNDGAPGLVIILW